MSIVMEIIESMIFDQSKASEAAQRCRFHPEVRPPVAANRGMAHSRAPLNRRRRLNGQAQPLRPKVGEASRGSSQLERGVRHPTWLGQKPQRS